MERIPPQDVSAEQCVLGGMMLSKDAIADVVEELRGRLLPAGARGIYDAILDLYGRGEPADAVTVSAELTKRGEIGRIGGAPYLHTLISSVPTAANAGFYARIVRERAMCVGWSTPARVSPSSGTRPMLVMSTSSSTGRRPRCTRSPSGAPARTTCR